MVGLTLMDRKSPTKITPCGSGKGKKAIARRDGHSGKERLEWVTTVEGLKEYTRRFAREALEAMNHIEERSYS